LKVGNILPASIVTSVTCSISETICPIQTTFVSIVSLLSIIRHHCKPIRTQDQQQ
jgi:hypothetical protein